MMKKGIKIFLVCLILLLNLNFASASLTGTIQVKKDYVSSGTFTGGTSNLTLPDWTKMSFDIADYNLPNSITIYPVKSTPAFFPVTVTYALNAESTSFNIVSGGSGSGWFSYDANSSSLYWVFALGSKATSGNITLSYGNMNVINNISISYDAGCAPYSRGMFKTASVTYPLLIGGNNNLGGLIGLRYASNTCGATGGVNYFQYVLGYGIDTTVDYNLTYLSGNYANLLINKSSSYQSTKIILSDASNSIITQEPTFNKINYNPSFSITNGLYINVTTSYDSNKVFVTASNGVIANLNFDKSAYNIGERATVTLSQFDNPDFSNYVYFYELIDSDGLTRETGQVFPNVVIPASDTADTLFDKVGTWSIRLYSCGYGNCVLNRRNLDTGTATVSGSLGLYGNISFSKSSYQLGQQLVLNYNLVSPDFSKYDYSIEFYDTAGSLSYTKHLTANTGSYSPIHSFTTSGYYSAWLRVIAYGSVQKTTLDTTTVFYGGGGNNTSLSGNITIVNTSFNRTETIPIKFNISLNGRIQINTPYNSLFYNVNSGNGQTLNYYLPNNAPIGSYSVYLQYFDGLTWDILDFDTFTVSSTGQNVIEFTDPTKIYLQGETITLNAIGTDNGYFTLLDTHNVIRLNSTITANTLTSKNYYISNTDSTGAWIVKLYNSTGSIVATDYADIYTSGYGQVNPTAPGITSNTNSGSGSIDYVGNTTARKAAENSFFNTFYGAMNALFTLAILGTMVMFLKLMGKW